MFRQFEEHKLFNLKSHDYHILMKDFPPIALRVAKDSDVVDLVMVRSAFFKELCAKELTVEKLDEVGANVVVTLCRMKKLYCFLPVFLLSWCI